MTNVPILSPGKFTTKGDQDRPDEQHPDKVCSGNLLTDCMRYNILLLTQHDNNTKILDLHAHINCLA